MRAVDNIVGFYCAKTQLEGHVANAFYKTLQEKVNFEHLDEVLNNIPALCQRLWCCIETLYPDGPEFCSILNFAIRVDDRDVADHLATLSRAMSVLLVSRRMQANEPPAEFPRDGKTYRGTSMLEAECLFYQVGQKYRVPGFLATSFEEDTARIFAERSFVQNAAAKLSAVIFVVQVNSQGADDPQKLCKNAKFVTKTDVSDEREYLFVPYSVFTVTRCEWSSALLGNSGNATYEDPHRIYVQAAQDNALEEEDLPLAPWY